MRSSAVPSWRALLSPACVGLPRAILEGVVGCCALLGLAAAAAWAGAPALLAWAWLVWWPAWRLRRLGGRRSRWRIVRHLGRALLASLLLGLSAQVLGHLPGEPPSPAHVAAGLVFVLFLVARTVVVVALAVRRHVRRHLRWQLTLSHLAVIVLTFGAVTAVGSLIAVGLTLRALQPDTRTMKSVTLVARSALVQPDTRTMAVSVADALGVAIHGGAIERRRAQMVLDALATGRLQIRGEPPLPAVWSHPLVPSRILALSPDGTVLAAALPASEPFRSGAQQATAPLPAAIWRQLRHEIRSGHPATLPVHAALWPDQRPVVLGAAPIVAASGRLIAVSVVQVQSVAPVPTPTPTSARQFLGYTVALISVSTLILIGVTAVPVFALCSLFGYLLARGLTRRLEAVSRVTTAIASGDLTQRVPLKAENEVGALAENVNRMADHLEKAMGELRQARAQAVEALRARQELVANVSHELRTPLAVVRAHLDTLALRQPAAIGGGRAQEGEVIVPRTTVQALQNETQRLASLVDDLFALSRAQTAELQSPVLCVPVDVAALVGEVANLMRPLAQREGQITLSFQAPPGLPPALADPDRLRQILENLVRNAVRHTPDGGIIVLSVASEGPWIAVCVADTGEGIPPEHLPHIFERFYRVDQARTRSSGGAGLGLAIVREFTELMGGHVEVDSTPGEGSCFRVFLARAGVAL